MTILLFTILIMKLKKWNAERRLRWQLALVNKGIGFRTEVLHVKKEKNLLKDWVKYSLLIHLRVKGKVVCRQVYTLLKDDGALQAGDRVHIRYNPHQLNYVLLCSDR